jgi:aldehyde dehydrogenase (NAD+)
MSSNTEAVAHGNVAEAKRICDSQRQYRWTAKQTTSDERKAILERLRGAIVANFDAAVDALYADLGRPRGLSKAEIGAVLHDIDEATRNLDEWMAPTRVTPQIDPAASAEIRYEGRGVVLLFGPWNFPFGLVFQPLVPIIAAGNTCIVKPNELAPATSALTAQIIRSVFNEEHVAVLEGGVELAEGLLDLPVDHIFFTGSPAVARTVMSKAAEHLASVTLELGGKCPAVVDQSADLTAAVSHIAAGKHQNAGQICLAPDHVWVHEDVSDQFISGYVDWITANLCNDDQLVVDRLGRLVNQRNFDRVQRYVDEALQRGAKSTVVGSNPQSPLAIAPTVLTGVDTESAVMRDEIFGPVMPILTYRDISTVIESIRRQGKPLAMYIFSQDDAMIESILAETSSGGVTINGWAAHCSDTSLPFGGVGASGMGRYHGVYGFQELSNARSIFVAGPTK